jgi:hypothetical protein
MVEELALAVGQHECAFVGRFVQQHAAALNKGRDRLTCNQPAVCPAPALARGGSGIKFVRYESATCCLRLMGKVQRAARFPTRRAARRSAEQAAEASPGGQGPNRPSPCWPPRGDERMTASP